MANQNTFYTDKEIRDSQNIALSAWQKYDIWYEQYTKEKAEAREQYFKEIIIRISK